MNRGQLFHTVKAFAISSSRYASARQHKWRRFCFELWRLHSPLIWPPLKCHWY